MDDGKGNRVRLIADESQQVGRVTCQHGSFKVVDATTCQECWGIGVSLAGEERNLLSIIRDMEASVAPLRAKVKELEERNCYGDGRCGAMKERDTLRATIARVEAVFGMYDWAAMPSPKTGRAYETPVGLSYLAAREALDRIAAALRGDT